jgi:hypothetical protein
MGEEGGEGGAEDAVISVSCGGGGGGPTDCCIRERELVSQRRHSYELLALGVER